jgi:ubiquinone/menaquinone biosynthesis C-methylase UbiE
MHEPDVEKLKHSLTYEQWCKWEQFYDQDPWGELRADMRSTAHYLFQQGSEDVSPFMPYFGETEAEQIESKKRLEERKAELSQEELAERFRKAREQHFANKKKNG